MSSHLLRAALCAGPLAFAALAAANAHEIVGNRIFPATLAIDDPGVNRQSGSNAGAIGHIHFFLDDIFPNSIGRPIFGNGIASGKPVFGNKP